MKKLLLKDMSKQAIETLGVSARAIRRGGALRGLKSVAAAAAALSFIALAAAAGTLQAQTKAAGTNTVTQNVNVVNTPTVKIGMMPAVSLNGTPTVNVGSLPPVNLAGTPTVNANVTFPSNQAVTVTGGPLTNVGRLPSEHVTLIPGIPVGCTTTWGQVTADGTISCFDMANHPGQVLVVTDFYWEGQGPAGSNCVAFLLSGGAAWYLIKSGAIVASDGFISKSEHLATGATVTGNPTFHGIPGGSCGIFDAQLHGYLLPNQ